MTDVQPECTEAPVAVRAFSADANICCFLSLPAEDVECGWAAEEAVGAGPHDGAGDRGDPPEVPVQAAAHPRCHWSQEAAAAELLSHG